MTLLICGVLLWVAGHFLKRAAPQMRERMGPAGKGVVAAAIAAGLVLMVLGYRASPWIEVYQPIPWGVHVNNLLMLVAVFLFGLGSSKSSLRGRIRHPMLIGMVLWAVAHLIVNGDLASVLLFGSLGLWAVAEMVVIGAREPVWHRFEGGSLGGTVRLVLISVIVFVVVASAHAWLGVWPFPV